MDLAWFLHGGGHGPDGVAVKTLVGSPEPPPREEYYRLLQALRAALAKAQREVREMPK